MGAAILGAALRGGGRAAPALPPLRVLRPLRSSREATGASPGPLPGLVAHGPPAVEAVLPWAAAGVSCQAAHGCLGTLARLLCLSRPAEVRSRRLWVFLDL